MEKAFKSPEMEEVIQFYNLDSFLEKMRNTGEVTAGEITEVMRLLQHARDKVCQLEEKERCRRDLEEREQREREAEEKREAHIHDVTSMVLPMDWENVFIGDSRAEGIHAESIPDGLILSLSNQGRVDKYRPL